MKKRPIKYRLGLDVGTNSLGWCVLELNKDEEPFRIESAGARIFSEGREDKTKSTLKATRREKRSARRRRDRFKQRQKFLLSELEKFKLFPKDEKEREDLQKLNPLELRAKALREKIAPYEIGRAFFHINQRRGFQSNRKDKSEEVTSGKVNNSFLELLKKMELMEEGLSDEEYKKLSKKEDKKKHREQKFASKEKAMEDLKNNPEFSFGSFLWKQHKNEPPIPTRARPNSETNLYDFYPIRELYKDEFWKICKAQEKYHKSLLSESVCERIYQVIFTQRPLKPQTVGKCAYLSKEDRAFKAMPSFQRYRIYQEVNNLEWSISRKKSKLRDFPEARDAIIELLEKPTTQKGNVTFGNMKKVLKKYFEELGNPIGEINFNYETPKRNGFDGNLTSNVMSNEDCLGEEWHSWNLKKQDEFIEKIIDNKKKG